LASDEEGFGLVVVEAMASGVPVVSTRSGGPDSIVTDGKDGFLVPCGDAAAMAERMHLLANDVVLNLAMGKAARCTAEMRFDERVAGLAFLDTYDRLLERQQ
jgi:glycosyltransferase involved in cell wall biosynthesis